MYVPHYTAPVVIEVVSFEPSARVVEGVGFLVRVTGVKVFSFFYESPGRPALHLENIHTRAIKFNKLFNS